MTVSLEHSVDQPVVLTVSPSHRFTVSRHARRGVASVLAMMFLVIFGSLAAAMAVVAQGNLRSADSGLKLSKAMSAAETGLTFATRRLASESSRFVVSKGVIDSAFAVKLWMGTYSSPADGTVSVLPPTGYTVSTPPSGIVQAVRDAHLADSHSAVIESGDSSLPAIDTQFGTLRVRPIRLGPDATDPYFRLTFELVNGQSAVRVTSEGVDGDIHRTLHMDFKLTKRIKYAVISPNRIMIGKNVHVEGPLGSRYGIGPDELNSANGDPLVMRSDFYYLNATLNANIDILTAAVRDFDSDGDNRLRPNLPAENAGLSSHPELVDVDGDEFVDDFDLFLAQYDLNGDKRVVYDSALANAAGLGTPQAEFLNETNAVPDPQLARLIDMANSDRDGDGESGTASDIGLGYNDGVLDINDQYAKVKGRLMFAVARSPWDTANGASYQTIVNGAVRIEEPEDAPVKFEVPDTEMREITTDMFQDSQTWFAAQAGAGAPFATQAGAGGTYTAPGVNSWESMPYGADENLGAQFGSHGAYDYYQRPKYENMTFTNVTIPKGNNGLFVNCTFKGVTFIQTEADCDDVNWNYVGAVERKVDPNTGVVTYPVRFPTYTATYGASSTTVDSTSNGGTGTKGISNNLRFHDCTFLGSVSGDRPGQFTNWRNKVQMTGDTRFYIDVDEPELSQPTHPDYQADAAAIVTALNSLPAAAIDEMKKSSMLMPGWSIDVGSYVNEQAPLPSDTPKVKLKGTIIAGILDVRGTADVHGTLMMTFRPVDNEGPLFYGGLMDGFNTTIGYFYPSDGDGEGSDPGDIGDPTVSGFGEITLRYNPDARLPDGIPWPVTMEADPTTYSE